MTDNLTDLFANVRAILAEFDGVFLVEADGPDKYSLTTPGPVTIGERRYPTFFFAAIMPRKASVALHFMPLYGHDEFLEKLGPGLRKTLKGLTCFHITKWNPEIASEIRDALNEGVLAYQERGWLAN